MPTRRYFAPLTLPSNSRRRLLLWMVALLFFFPVLVIHIKNAKTSISAHVAKTGQLVSVPNCNCQKLVERKPGDSGVDVEYTDTTCGETAYARGSGQMVVGFSFYGNPNSSNLHVGKKYFEGIRENLKLMPKYYPGWVMRCMHDLLSIFVKLLLHTFGNILLFQTVLRR
jgi:hypothetical protein